MTEDETLARDRQRVLELLKAYGSHATSFQMLASGLRYWFGEESCVAYANVSGAWVVAGEPVGPERLLRHAVNELFDDARVLGRRVALFHAGPRVAALPHVKALPIGELPWWDPGAFGQVAKRSRNIKEQLRRARAKKVETRALSADEVGEGTPLRAELDTVVQAWIASRSMQRMHFMVELEPFDYAEERRYVAAFHQGVPVVLGVAVPIYAAGGFFIEHLIRHPSAPNGSVELVVKGLMDQFAAEGASCATLGLAPLSGDVSQVLALTRDATRSLYNFKGVRAFKEKLCPDRWDPVYLVYPEKQSVTLTLKDVLHAFAAEGFVRFGLDTVMRKLRPR